jgi:hypothetical protein
MITLAYKSSGELELTMHQSFIRAGRLKAWLARSECPPGIRECKILFDKLLPNVYTQTEPSVSLPESETEITTPARYQHGGVSFTRSSTHLGNSQILFYTGGDQHTPLVPGVIKSIRVQGGIPSFIVNRHQPLDNQVADPFKRYPYMEIKLYSAQLDPETEVVELNWVVAHFARYQFQQEYVAVLSLSRVSCHLLLPTSY